MQKIAVGPGARGAIDINKSLEENIHNLADALNKDITEITVMIQDRKRHEALISEARNIGVRVKVFGEGDIAAALATAFEDTGVDMLVGIGGAPEGVLAAAAIKCLGGDMQGRLLPMSEDEKNRCLQMGISDYNKVMALDDIVKGDSIYFAATGVSDGDLLRGVVYYGNERAKTQSVVMRAKTGTIRFINTIHNLNKVKKPD
jgi:fructose-1,6-bisphosphatase II